MTVRHAALLALVLASPAFAAGSRKAAPGTATATPVSGPLAGQTPAPVLRLDPMTIEGRIAKPKAIYSLQRAAPAFGELVPEESFVPKIVESVEEDPF